MWIRIRSSAHSVYRYRSYRYQAYLLVIIKPFSQLSHINLYFFRLVDIRVSSEETQVIPNTFIARFYSYDGQVRWYLPYSIEFIRLCWIFELTMPTQPCTSKRNLEKFRFLAGLCPSYQNSKLTPGPRCCRAVYQKESSKENVYGRLNMHLSFNY